MKPECKSCEKLRVETSSTGYGMPVRSREYCIEEVEDRPCINSTCTPEKLVKTTGGGRNKGVGE